MRRSKSRESFRRRSRCSLLTACSIVWGKRSRRRKLSAVSCQFSVLSSQFSVLSSQFSVLSSQFSVLSSQFSVLSSQFSVISSQFSVLSSQFSSAPLLEAQSAKILKAVLRSSHWGLMATRLGRQTGGDVPPWLLHMLGLLASLMLT